jgi:hypothetical protein
MQQDNQELQHEQESQQHKDPLKRIKELEELVKELSTLLSNEREVSYLYSVRIQSYDKHLTIEKRKTERLQNEID